MQVLYGSAWLLCKQGVVGSIPIVSTIKAPGSSAAGGFLVPGVWGLATSVAH